jgi:hypothetical protein
MTSNSLRYLDRTDVWRPAEVFIYVLTCAYMLMCVRKRDDEYMWGFVAYVLTFPYLLMCASLCTKYMPTITII